MKRTILFVATLLVASIAHAQLKVAILETVDKAENVSYGVKLLLRSSLTSAISNTPGYEGYDRVDVASITGEQEFQRTGNVSDNQIKQIGRAAGAAYVLVAEAARYDATSIIITAKMLDVETFGVKSSAVLVSGISADEMQESCNILAAKLLGLSVPARTEQRNPHSAQATAKVAQQQQTAAANNDASQNSTVGEVGSVIVFPDRSRGIIFYKDYGVGLAVSMDETEAAWHTAVKRKERKDIPQIPNNEDDGKYFSAGRGAEFTNAIVSQLPAGTAPAAEWCVRHGMGWYLPSAGELVQLFKANDKQAGSKINVGLVRNGGTKLDGSWYWSSSEIDIKEAVNVSGSGRDSGEDKKTPAKVRAIRAFNY